MSAVVRNAPVHPTGTVRSIMQTYNHMRPLIDQVKPILENKHVQQGALIAVGYIGTKIKTVGVWILERVGLLSPSKKENPVFDKLHEIFPDLNTTNTAAVVEKLQELADNITKLTSTQDPCHKLYTAAQSQTKKLLQSPTTNNDVKLSIIEAGLEVLPELNHDNAILSLNDWIKNAGYCHESKLKCEQREIEAKGDLSSCQTDKDKLNTDKDKLNKEIRDLEVKKSKEIGDLKDKCSEEISDQRYFYQEELRDLKCSAQDEEIDQLKDELKNKNIAFEALLNEKIHFALVEKTRCCDPLHKCDQDFNKLLEDFNKLLEEYGKCHQELTKCPKNKGFFG